MWTDHPRVAGPILFGHVWFEWDLVLASVGLLILVGFGVWAIVKVKNWRRQETDDLGPTPQELLDHCQKMADDGLLDPEELARIKARLERRPSPTEPGPTASDQPPDTSIREP